MVKYFFTALITAIVSNLFAGYVGLNYVWSVLIGMGLPALVIWYSGMKEVSFQEWKPFFAFNIFSIISSTIIEIIMLKYDTWGFSNHHYRLIGINLFGAPIEEYVYWWCAPILVGITYVIFNKINKVEELPPVIEGAIAWLSSRSSYIMIKSVATDATEYLENEGVAVQEGNYLRGSVYFPTWVWIPIMIVAILIYLKQYFKGSYVKVFLTSLIFACVAFIGERHAIDYGFWAYNKQRVIGIFLFNIPIEEYPMYFLSAIFECVVIDIISKNFFKETI